VGALAVRSSFSETLRSVTTVFTIAGTNPRLMPDLSAAVDVELERVPGVLVAPRDAIVERSGQTFVRVQRGGRFETRKVTLRTTSDHEAVIASGVEAGDVILRGNSAWGVS
jgi:hypothetical protein